MKKKREQQDSVTDWWLPTRIIKSPDAFPQGFCAYAEHWYLAMLVLLASDSKLRRQELPSMQKVATAKRVDLKRGVEVSGVQKRNLVSRDKKYYLGNDSFLILTGLLAGTLASVSEKKRIFRKPTLQLETVRPLHDHHKVLSLVEYETPVFSGSDKHIHELLLAARDAVIEHGYVHALLYYLDKVGLPHSPESILDNQVIFSRYVRS